MYGIAKSIAKGEPFKRPAFPKLKDIAVDEVAENFQLYPELEGIPDELKEKVKKYNFFLYIKRSSQKRALIMRNYP